MPSETVVVIGGGPGGLRAAQGIAELGGTAVLIEQRDFLGGTPVAENYCGLTPRGEPAQPQIRQMVDLVTAHPLIEVRLGTEVAGVAGGPGAFTLRLRRAATAETQPSGDETIECGAIIIATGFAHFDPGRATQMYGYYEFPDVITQPDLEAMLSEGRVLRPSNGQPPERVCFVQCVGSRDRQIGNEYCSKVCCGVASKEAIEIRELLPDSKVLIFYIDMRMYGYWENEIYWPAQEQHHVQYVKGLITEVLPKGIACSSAARTPPWAARWKSSWTSSCCRWAWSHQRAPASSRACSGSSRTSTGSSRPSQSRSTPSVRTGRQSLPAAPP